MTLSDDIARRRALAEAVRRESWRIVVKCGPGSVQDMDYLEAHHPGIVKALWDVAEEARHYAEGNGDLLPLMDALAALAAAMREERP